MPVKKTSWLDVMLDCWLSGFRFWRRWRGGCWYYVYELPMVQGGFMLWCQHLYPTIPGTLLGLEDYADGVHVHGVNVPKPDYFNGNFGRGWLEA